MYAKEFSPLEKSLLVQTYRACADVRQEMSDKKFHQLENRLRDLDPQNSYFKQRMKFLSLNNFCFSKRLADRARNETMIVQPRFD